MTIFVACVQLVFSGRAARAGIDEPTLSYILHYFTDVDGVDVVSQYGSTDVRVGDNATVAVQWAHDMVIFPAIEAPPGSQEAADAITTASRPITTSAEAYEDFVKTRDEFEAIATYRGAKASYYVSKETDYFAQMVSVGYIRGFFNQNLTLTGGASYGWDDIKPLADQDTQGIPDERTTLHGHLIATQVLTPTTVLRLGGEFFNVRGLQHDSYRNVYVAGTNVPELHPNRRDRWDVFLRVSQYITNRSSVKVDYRYYSDDWGIKSHTIGGKLNQYITDEFVVRYRYRYYTQLPAFFFREDYNFAGGVSGFRTGDYRLGGYGAHLFGGRIIWFPHRILGNIGFLERAQVSVSYEHYFNSNNFSANVYEVGFGITF